MGPESVPGTPVTEREAVELLERLVSIPSPSGHEAKAAQALVEWMERHGWNAGRDEVGNAVGIRGWGSNEILLLGHMDTFPGEMPVRRDGGSLYGRGTVDAKGPLCAFAVAASMVDVPAGWRITVVGAVEEESTTSRGARHVLSLRPPGRAPRYCIIGEPSRWDRVTLAYKGCLHVHVDLTYPYSHSAGEGRLPAEAAVDLWDAVKTFCGERNRGRPEREFDRLTCSLHSLVTRQEGAFGLASLHIGFRLPPGCETDALEGEVRGVLEGRVLAAPQGAAITTVFSGAEPPHRSPKSGPLVRAFLGAIRGAGGAPRFVVKTGSSDMNVVAPAWPDTHVVAYGPGDSALDHTPDEHMGLREFDRAVAVLKSVLTEVLSAPAT